MSVGLRSNGNTFLPRLNGLEQQSLIKTARYHSMEYRSPSSKMAISLFVNTPIHTGMRERVHPPHTPSLLTVSDRAMQTKVNFLMWAEVTVVLVFASLLLGLFWEDRRAVMTRLGYPWLSPRVTKSTLFCLTCLKYGLQVTAWKMAVTSGL